MLQIKKCRLTELDNSLSYVKSLDFCGRSFVKYSYQSKSSVSLSISSVGKSWGTVLTSVKFELKLHSKLNKLHCISYCN